MKNIYSPIIHNDLEPYVIKTYPRIKKNKKGLAFVTGSGGDLFKLNKSVKIVGKQKQKDNKNNKRINNTTSPHCI
jgi:4-diphosphocytidyl-2C-methyl-D-erythritol kinase